MTVVVTDMTHIYREEYAKIGLVYDAPTYAVAQNSMMWSYAKSRGWGDDFRHDDERFRLALRYALGAGYR